MCSSFDHDWDCDHEVVTVGFRKLKQKFENLPIPSEFDVCSESVQASMPQPVVMQLSKMKNRFPVDIVDSGKFIHNLKLAGICKNQEYEEIILIG